MALRATFAELMQVDGARMRLAGLLSGLDVGYDLGEGHPLLGRRVPDLDLVTADGPRRVYELLHGARHVLLELCPCDLDLGAWQGRVEQVVAETDAAWGLPLVGEVPAPGAVLIRPDGHVAWAGDGTETGLRNALSAWCGDLGDPR